MRSYESYSSPRGTKTPGPIRYNQHCALNLRLSSLNTLGQIKTLECLFAHLLPHTRSTHPSQRKVTLYFLSPLFFLLGSITPGLFFFPFLSLPPSSILFLRVEGKPVSLPLWSFQHAGVCTVCVWERERDFVLTYLHIYLKLWYLSVSVSCVLVPWLLTDMIIVSFHTSSL